MEAAGASIRPYRQSDFAALHDINAASTPGVSEETEEGLSEILSLATCFVAQDACERPIGFITLIEPGVSTYGSPNLRWFEAWQDREERSLIYVDRIAVAESARGSGLGEALYRHAFAQFADREVIAAEVNTIPDNPGSHRFHDRLGFVRVGQQVFTEGEKAVAYYIRKL